MSNERNNGFLIAIETRLDEMAASDPMFASVYKSGGKDIPDCCDFIIAEVRKTKRTGFSDEEIYGMAKHYFEEAGIQVFKGNAPECDVVTPSYPTTVKPVFAERKPRRRPAVSVDENQLSLF